MAHPSSSCSAPPFFALETAAPADSAVPNPVLLLGQPVTPLDPDFAGRIGPLRQETLDAALLSPGFVASGEVCTTPPPLTGQTDCSLLLAPLQRCLSPTNGLDGIVPISLRLVGTVLNEALSMISKAQRDRKHRGDRFKAHLGDESTVELSPAEAVRRALEALLTQLSSCMLDTEALGAIVWRRSRHWNNDATRQSFLSGTRGVHARSDGVCKTFQGDIARWFKICPDALHAIYLQEPNLLWTHNPSSPLTPSSFHQLANLFEGFGFFFSNFTKLLPIELGTQFFRDLADPKTDLSQNFAMIGNSIEPLLRRVIERCHQAQSMNSYDLKALYQAVCDLKLRNEQLCLNQPTCALKQWLRQTCKKSDAQMSDAAIEEAYTLLPGAKAGILMLDGVQRAFNLVMAITHRMCWSEICKHLTKPSAQELRRRFIILAQLLADNAESYCSISRPLLEDLPSQLPPEAQRWTGVFESTFHAIGDQLSLFRTCHHKLNSERDGLSPVLAQISWCILNCPLLNIYEDPQNPVGPEHPLFSLHDLFCIYTMFLKKVVFTTTVACNSVFEEALDQAHQTSKDRQETEVQRANKQAKALLSAEAAKKASPTHKVDSSSLPQGPQREPPKPRMSTWFGVSARNLPVDVSELLVAPDPVPLNPTEEKTDQVASHGPLSTAQKNKARKKKKREVTQGPPLSLSTVIPQQRLDMLLEQATSHPNALRVLPTIQNFALWAHQLGQIRSPLTLDGVFTETDLLRRMMESLCHYLLFGADLEVTQTHNLFELAQSVIASPKIHPRIKEVITSHLPLFSLMSHANASVNYPFSFDCRSPYQRRLRTHLLNMSVRPTDQHLRLMHLGFALLEHLTRTIVDPTSPFEAQVNYSLRLEFDLTEEPPPSLFNPVQLEEEAVAAASDASLPAPSFVRTLPYAEAAIQAAIRLIDLLLLNPVIGDEDAPLRCSLRDHALQNSRLALARLHESLSSQLPILEGLGEVELARRALKEFMIAAFLNRPIYEINQNGSWSHIVQGVRHTNSIGILHSKACRHFPSFQVPPPPPYLAILHLAFNYPYPYSYHHPRPPPIDKILRQIVGETDHPSTLKQVRQDWLFPILEYLLRFSDSLEIGS